MKKNTSTKTGDSEKVETVDFSCHAPEAKAVFVAGTFNEWTPDTLPMQRQSGGKWSVKVPLATGRYEFKFIVDGEWCCEEGCEGEYHGCPECVPNECGTMNRVLEVA